MTKSENGYKEKIASVREGLANSPKQPKKGDYKQLLLVYKVNNKVKA